MISHLNMFAKKSGLKVGDIFLFIIILALAFSCFFIVRQKGSWLIIRQNGTELYRIDLSADENESKEFVVKGEYTTVIQISDKEVCVSYTDCPDQICCHSLPITSEGGVICCAPNGVVISVEKENDWDVVVR